ncbi:hypothetical protein GE253_00815 [Niveispirillum sp. SYP-B3756]|uniref:hypothetical protein n=1 Tax=Niveispirillum sp. SYP-B3756 TaxID=2662178 RepID=UPI00129142A1|nr:hypothetical protein [Niveispirillum sp. SYP-B3756]MQP63876.1 hypothetical protein [Niveispirillum sp. SYP-B3756]
MTFSLMNMISLLVLAIAGAVLILSGRRVLRLIRQVERRLSRAVDEKNMLAVKLRQARREADNVRNAILEAETHIAQMVAATNAAEARLTRLREAPKQSILMLDREWRRFDRLWSLMIANGSLGRQEAAAGLPPWNEGRMFHGFARSPEELHARALTKYPPAEGFIAGVCAMADITADGPNAGQPVDVNGQSGRRHHGLSAHG